MAKNRIVYLVTLGSSIVFYLAYRQWLGWLILLTVLMMPVLSLLLSLPGLFTLKLQLVCPEYVPQGSRVPVEVISRCAFPVPTYRCRIRVTHSLTDSTCWLKEGQEYPTEHCGGLVCRIEKAWAYDYLGLFRFRLGDVAGGTILVRPQPEIIRQVPQLQRHLALRWKPKPGGGYGENHELRLYRPGDNLNQIHPKLSAKTGKLIIREPMIPVGRQGVLVIEILGTAEQLDKKFSRLLGVGNYLLDRELAYEIQGVTGEGIQTIPVRNARELYLAMDKLLCASPAEQEENSAIPGAWVYRIGGEADEQ